MCVLNKTNLVWLVLIDVLGLRGNMVVVIDQHAAHERVRLEELCDG